MASRFFKLKQLSPLATGLLVLPALMFLLALHENRMAVREFDDVNLSSSLRYRSLWLYGSAQNTTGEDRHTMLAQADAIRKRLRADYPSDVRATDFTWQELSEELNSHGRIDWQTANAARSAANVLTTVIERHARRQAARASWLMTIGFVGLALTLAALAAKTRSRAATAEAEKALLAERGEALIRLEDSQRLFQASLDAIQEGFVIQDTSGTILNCNHSAECILGLPAADYVGNNALQPGWTCFREDGTEFPRAQHPSRIALSTGTPQSGVVMGLQRDGLPVVWLYMSAYPLFRLDEDRPYAVVITFTDITARRQADEAIRKSQACLEEAQRIAHIGSWDYDIATNQISWSDELFRLFEMDPAEGAPAVEQLMKRYHPDDVAMHWEITNSAIENGRPYEFDIRILGPYGTHRWGHAVGQAGRDTDGNITRLFGTLMDITDRKEMEEELRDSKHFVESLAEHSTSIIYVIDLASGAFVYANRGFAEFVGYGIDEILGMKDKILAAVVHPDDLSFMTLHLAAFRDFADGHVVDYEMRVRHGSGEWRWLWNREIIFKRDKNGSVQQIIGTAQDITQRRETEAILLDSREGLETAQSLAHVGSWQIDLPARVGKWSAELFRIFGLKPSSTAPSYDDTMAMIHPDDRSELGGYLAQALSAGTPFEMQHRIVSADGSLRNVFTQCQSQRDGTGLLTRLQGTMIDNTERKQAEGRLSAATARLEALIANLHAGILVEDDQRQIVLANQEFCSLLGLSMSPYALLGANGTQMASRFRDAFKDPSEVAERMQAVVTARRPITGEEIVMADGRVLELDYVPIFLQDQYGGHLWHYRDVTERKQAEQKIQDYMVILEFQKSELEQSNSKLEGANGKLAMLATLDGLTNLKNHRAFQERLEEETMRSLRYNMALSLILLDVDNFKLYNDSFGHPAGDEILRTVAMILQENARESDLVARYGGEEFVIVLPHTDTAGALTIAERVRHAIEIAHWPSRAVTASVGVATLSPGMNGPSELIARADKALYLSKANGRNQVTADAPPESAAPVADPHEGVLQRWGGNHRAPF